MIKSRITRLLGTVLASTAMVAIPIVRARALDYWDRFTIIEDVVEGGQVVGQVRLPDWERIALEDFPAVNRGGSISSEFNTYVGYDLSREWLAGDSLVDILKLGDVEEAFAVQNFSIREIAELTGLETNSIALSSFELVKGQSLEELVESIPGLGQKRVGQVEPIATLIKNKLGYGFDDIRLESLIESNFLAGKLKLGEIDLSEYSIDAIPGLKDTFLGKFEGWENTLIRGIPGLAQVPLSQMPNPLSNRGEKNGNFR